MKSFLWSFSFLLVLLSCNHSIDKNALIEEVKNTELAFSAYSDSIGIEEAFLKFSDENAVLMRGNEIIRGKKEIKDYFSNQSLKNTNLIWAPDFIDVSEAGDLAYTFGKYTYTYSDSLGNPISSTGIFHTVWKKQQSGEWKFVYD